MFNVLFVRPGPVQRIMHHLLRVLRRIGVVLCAVAVRDSESRELLERMLAAYAGTATFRRLTEDECLALADHDAFDLSLAEIERSLEQGDVCFAAWIDGQLIGYSWSSTTTAPVNRYLRVRVPEGHVYGFRSVTLEAHRGQGIFPQFMLHGTHHSLTRGYSKRVSYVELQNRSSLSAILKTGYTVKGIAGYVTVFGRVFPFRSPAVAQLGFAFQKTAAARRGGVTSTSG